VQEGLGMARTAVEISRPRVWCYSPSSLAGGFSMVGTAKEQPYRDCEDGGGDIMAPSRGE
jgi:hypothetical protein